MSGEPQKMYLNEHIVKTPWDAKSLGIETYEIRLLSNHILDVALKYPGHYTVKTPPLASKKLLHDYGFYYCDTLLEPFCKVERFTPFNHDDIAVSKSVSIQDVLSISHGAFTHGRFHRDFNVDRKLADLRYDAWLSELYKQNNVIGILFHNQIAGFFATSDNRILLHALSIDYQGKGLAKYFWSAACRAMFESEYNELVSSISASNVAVLNVYSSLGFKFRNPLDVYHRIVI